MVSNNLFVDNNCSCDSACWLAGESAGELASDPAGDALPDSSPDPAFSPSLTSAFVHQNLMGPNAVTLACELCAADVRLAGARCICDLGCGMGISSMYLAQTYPQSVVYACDLWNAADENQARFAEHGFAGHVRAIQSDALDLPFCEGFFDVLISVDSYNYFGREEGVIDRIAAHVRPGGAILLAVPGLKEPLTDAAMETFGLSWTREQMEYLQTCAWWRELMERAEQVRVDAVEEMACFAEAWHEWLTCDNDYARGDRAAFEAGADAMMNIIAIRLTRI